MPYLEELFRKYIDGSITETERQELHELLRKGMADDVIREMIDAQFGAWEEEEDADPLLTARLFAQLEVKKSPRFPFTWLAIAACLLIAVGAGVMTWHIERSSKALENVADRYRNDVKPGGSKASLTLANGTVIDLDSSHSGLLTRQGNVVVSKQGNGRLLYAAIKTAGGSASPVRPAEEMNVLTTPRGGQYQVVLPDGTKVLLNAASSLRYPTVFTGKERKVMLTGEAYFEVTKDAAKPFLVETANMQVRVLGTSFDIMAYDNEAMIRTTLLTGKVKEISQEQDSVTLAPGQQAVLRRNGHGLTREAIDTDEVVAWKDGLFLYSNRANIPTIMRQLERWYDIDVHYQGAMPTQTFYGGIQRNLPLSKVLFILERTGVKFKIEGQDITVLNSSEK